MDDHWLARESTIKRLSVAFAIALGVTVLMDLFIERKATFGLEATFGFGAWFGFLSCVALIAFAKALGGVLQRPDTYYDG